MTDETQFRRYRVPLERAGRIKQLARLNNRSETGEVNAALEKHLAANRAKLRKGPKGIK